MQNQANRTRGSLVSRARCVSTMQARHSPFIGQRRLARRVCRRLRVAFIRIARIARFQACAPLLPLKTGKLVAAAAK